MYEEYRCFWNSGLVAVSGYLECNLNNEMVNLIMKYIESIKDRIAFIRCVFDICRVKDANGDDFIFKII